MLERLLKDYWSFNFGALLQLVSLTLTIENRLHLEMRRLSYIAYVEGWAASIGLVTQSVPILHGLALALSCMQIKKHTLTMCVSSSR